MSNSVQTIKNGKFEMDYCSFGRGEKKLVIVPGLSVQSVAASADAVAAAYKLLTDDYTIYLFDRRKNVPAVYTQSDMADDTAEACRELGIGRACFYGASQGGMICMEIAVKYPELVEKLVVASTTAHAYDERFRQIQQWVELAEKGDAEALYLSFAENIFADETFKAVRSLYIDAAKTVTDEELGNFIIIANAISGFDIRADLRSIDCPMLAIGDKKDCVFGADAVPEIGRIMEGHPNFEMYMYDGYGHAVYDAAPDFVYRMKDFLQN